MKISENDFKILAEILLASIIQVMVLGSKYYEHSELYFRFPHCQVSSFWLRDLLKFCHLVQVASYPPSVSDEDLWILLYSSLRNLVRLSYVSHLASVRSAHQKPLWKSSQKSCWVSFISDRLLAFAAHFVKLSWNWPELNHTIKQNILWHHFNFHLNLENSHFSRVFKNK